MVPMPASVNSSSSSECGWEPSMMWAEETPPRIASTQAPSFGRMPPPTPSRARSTSSTPARETSEPGIRRVGEPAGDVGEEDRLVGAERRRDLAGGGVGVDVVGVALAVGARRGDHRDVVLGDVVEDVDVDPLDLADEARPAPRPDGGGSRTGVPSSPDRPTDGWPWRLSRLTMSEFTFPSSTIFATSTVSGSETRTPSTKRTSIPRRSM